MFKFAYFLPLITLIACSSPTSIPDDATSSRDQNLLLADWPEKPEDVLAMFECSDPSIFRANDDGTFELHGKSKYKPRVRSPRCVALIVDKEFGDFVMEAELLQTGRDYGHRDLCLFFGVQSDTQFYYVHLATKADDHAHNIFRVDDAPRTKIASETTAGIDWGRERWHKIKIERELESAVIRVYFDNMKIPIMVARDDSFGWGKIGFGSFDDTGKIRNLRVRGSVARSTTEKVFVRRERVLDK